MFRVAAKRNKMQDKMYLCFSLFFAIDADFLAFFLLTLFLTLSRRSCVICGTKPGDETVLLLLKKKKKKENLLLLHSICESTHRSYFFQATLQPSSNSLLGNFLLDNILKLLSCEQLL